MTPFGWLPQYNNLNQPFPWRPSFDPFSLTNPYSARKPRLPCSGVHVAQPGSEATRSFFCRVRANRSTRTRAPLTLSGMSACSGNCRCS